MSIFSACFGLPTTVQLPATTWSGQIWISGLILLHFDVRTISVASKLEELLNIFDKKYFSYHTMLSLVKALSLVHGNDDCFMDPSGDNL